MVLFQIGWRVPAASALAAAVLACGVVAGCGGGSAGPPTLTWYALPDNGGEAKMAEQCGESSGGAYRVALEVLPSDATAQREQLVRRLAARDSSIDVMSLDVIYTAEFANAGFLRPYTADETARLTEGRLPAPVETGLWKGVLYAAPMKSNAQLLWYRKSAVQAAGVDPTSPTFTWDDMLAAAESTGKKISEQGARYEGYMVWVNALVTSGGGQVITNVDAGAGATPSLDSPAGLKAAQIVGDLARSPAAASNLSVAQEEQGRAVFQSDQGMFMLNWPYVLAAARTAAEEGTLDRSVADDIAWARYPRVFADQPSAPPLGGANLAIGAYSRYPELSAALVECVTSLQNATQYMLDEGEPSPWAASYDDPRILASYPNADLIRTSIAEAGPRPITPYYVDVAGSVINTWHPADTVGPATPELTDRFMADVLAGRRLL